MPLLKGRENVGRNVKTEEAAGKPKAQAVAIALKTAEVPKAKDQPMPVTQGSAAPMRARNTEDGYSISDHWKGRRA